MSAWAAYRQLLTNKPLARLLFGEFISSIGDGVYLVALVVLVYARTDDPAILGAVGAAIIVPKFVLSIPAGIVTDRFDRRLVLLASDLGCALCMVALAFLVAADADIVVIAAVTILAACFSTFFSPAFGALLPSLVRYESEFGPANSAWATLNNFAYVLGPAVAGVVLLVGSPQVAFMLNAASYLVVGLVLWRLPRSAARPIAPRRVPDAEPVPAGRPRRRRPSFGLPASIDRAAVSGVVLLDSISWGVYGGMAIILVVLAVDVFKAGEAATGYLNAAIGAGGAIGALLSGVLVLRPRLAPALLLSGVTAAASLLLLGIAPGLPVAIVAVGATCVGMMVIDVATTTIFQRVVPDEYRGRLTGIHVTSTGAAETIGTFMVPVLVGVLGAALVLGVMGALLLAATLAAIVLIGRAADVTPGEFDAALRRLARLPIFGGLHVSQVEAGLRQLEPLRVVAGTVVIRQGDPSDRFYVVAEGSFDVTVSIGGRAQHVRHLEQDAVFGERGLLARSPRTATVTAREPGLLFAMDGQAFIELVTRHRGMAERFLELYDRSASPLDAPNSP